MSMRPNPIGDHLPWIDSHTGEIVHPRPPEPDTILVDPGEIVLRIDPELGKALDELLTRTLHPSAALENRERLPLLVLQAALSVSTAQMHHRVTERGLRELEGL